MKQFGQKISLAAFVLLINIIRLYAQDGGGIYEVGPLMNRTRIVPMAATLQDSRVVLFGGRENGFISSIYADIYDPSGNSFSEISMNNPHDGTCVVKLNNGKYMVLGGSEDSGVAPGYTVTEIFDPSDNSFTLSTPMIYSRMQHNATQLADGRILVAGAWYNPQAAATGEVIDLAAGTSVLTGNMITLRAAAMVLPTDDGNAVVFGGYSIYGTEMITAVEKFDHSDNTFSAVSDEIIPGEIGWFVHSNIHNGPSSEYRLSDGRYAFLIYRITPYLEYAVAFFDPSDKSFEKLVTNAPIFNDVLNGAIYDAVVDISHNNMYLLGSGTGGPLTQVGIIGVDLTTGNTQHPTTLYSLVADEYLFPTMAFLTYDDRILLTGISTSPVDYFNATNKTYLITPDEIVSVPKLENNLSMSLFPNPAATSTNILLNAAIGGSATLSIIDMMGKLILSENKVIIPGEQRWQLTLEKLTPGCYIVSIILNNTMNGSADVTSVLKLVIE